MDVNQAAKLQKTRELCKYIGVRNFSRKKEQKHDKGKRSKEAKGRQRQNAGKKQAITAGKTTGYTKYPSEISASTPYGQQLANDAVIPKNKYFRMEPQ